MTAADQKRAGSSSRAGRSASPKPAMRSNLTEGVFTRDDPASIARSLKRSAARSRRRKADPYRSAMSMLTYYINRAGGTQPKTAARRNPLRGVPPYWLRLVFAADFIGGHGDGKLVGSGGYQVAADHPSQGGLRTHRTFAPRSIGGTVNQANRCVANFTAV